MNLTTESLPAESIDHRLSTIKRELERIYEAQEMLLPKVHASLREDFCMTRADRIRALAEEERENHHLLNAWVMSAPVEGAG